MVARRKVGAIRRLRFSSRVQVDVEAVDARGGRALDPRNHGAQGHCREAGQYPDRGYLRKMRRAKSRLGRKGRDPGEIRLQAMRTPATDALRILPPSLRGAQRRSNALLVFPRRCQGVRPLAGPMTRAASNPESTDSP